MLASISTDISFSKQVDHWKAALETIDEQDDRYSVVEHLIQMTDDRESRRNGRAVRRIAFERIEFLHQITI